MCLRDVSPPWIGGLTPLSHTNYWPPVSLIALLLTQCWKSLLTPSRMQHRLYLKTKDRSIIGHWVESLPYDKHYSIQVFSLTFLYLLMHNLFYSIIFLNFTTLFSQHPLPSSECQLEVEWSTMNLIVDSHQQ